MEVMLMNSEITYLDNPITVDAQDWVLSNVGLVAAGIPLEDDSKVMIIAIQKANYTTEQMANYAKAHNALILETISEGEENYI